MAGSMRRRSFLTMLMGGALAPSVAAAQGNGLPASGTFERQAAEIRAIVAKATEDDVRALIATWYAETRKRQDGRRELLLAPMAIVERCPPKENCNVPRSAVLKDFDWRERQDLAWRSLDFSFEIRKLRIDPNFARVDVWERGWFFAADPQTSYENAAQTLFLLERNVKGVWKIMAHQSSSSAVHPDHENDPMPDMRDEYYDLIGQEPPEQ